MSADEFERCDQQRIDEQVQSAADGIDAHEMGPLPGDGARSAGGGKREPAIGGPREGDGTKERSQARQVGPGDVRVEQDHQNR